MQSFVPTSPDLPMPIRTTLPLQWIEDIDGLKKHVIDPLCKVEDRLSLNPQHPFGLLNYRYGHSFLDQSSYETSGNGPVAKDFSVKPTP